MHVFIRIENEVQMLPQARRLWAGLGATLLVLLVGACALAPVLAVRRQQIVTISSQAPYSPGVIFLWRTIDPRDTWVQVRRIRLWPGAGAPALLRRSIANSLAPISVVDDGARPGDCFIGSSGYTQRSAEVTTSTLLIGCLFE